MNAFRRERGVTLIGFIIILAIVGFFVIIGMKIVPMYTEYYNVSQVLEEVSDEPGLAAKSSYAIKVSIFNRLHVNYVTSIEEKHIRITRKDGVRVRISYEKRKHLIGNLDVVGTFDKEVVLRG